MNRPTDEQIPDNPLQEYWRLVAQKRALEQLVRVTESIERLHTGLQAAVLLGKPTNLIGPSALRFFQELSASTRLQPTGKLRITLAHLEERMRVLLQQVMTIAEQEPLSAAPEIFGDANARSINEFRRVSQTAVALRILLRERGEATVPLNLPVSHSALRERMRKVAEQESRCREKVMDDILTVQVDARLLLDTESLSGPMRRMLVATVEQLDANLAHIQAGNSIESLPHPVEVIELAEEVVVEPVEIDVPCAQAEQTEPGGEAEGSVLRQLDEWLNTPWTVSWKEIRSRRPEERMPPGAEGS